MNGKTAQETVDREKDGKGIRRDGVFSESVYPGIGVPVKQMTDSSKKR